jgi:ribosomal protein S12 methylthiotransferase
MPIQHASVRMLERMRRPERPDRLRDKIAWLRSEIPDLTIRTTVVVGFPGESEEDFEELLDFMRDVQFEHLGAFAYSPQPGTAGATMPDPVPDSLKMERLSLVNELQRSIVASRNREQIGSSVEVIVDRPATGDVTEGMEGRSRGQAFEIDGLTYITTSDVELAPGDLALATVINADDADVWAVATQRVRAARQPTEYIEATTLDLQTAWGR